MSINVVIVEDCEDVRSDFVDLFSDNEEINCIGAYPDAEDFLSEYSFLNIDVVFMDLQLPGMDGIDCIRFLKKQKTDIHFIVYSVFEDSDRIFNAIKAGASGYLLKSTSPEKIVSSAFEIMRGESPMSGSIAMKVIRSFQGPTVSVEASLTKFENEILSRLSQGYRYREIAELLQIDDQEIKINLRKIYEKLLVNSRKEAISRFSDLNNGEKTKYSGYYLVDDKLKEIIDALDNLFLTEKIYLEPNISISKISRKLGIPSYALSQAINSKLSKNFFDYINFWRVNEACEKLKAPEYIDITFEAIAYDCGFGT